MNDIHIDRKDIPPMLLQVFPGYNGKKFKVCQTAKVDLTGAFWDGGSRSEYRAVSLDTGEVSPADSKLQNPFTPGYTIPTVEIPPRVCIVEHVIFCGKDMGLIFHINPGDTQGMLPAPVELTEGEISVLLATRGLKSSYGGQSRREMAGIALDVWTEASETLKAKGLLAKNGAITTNGRNAIADKSAKNF